MFQNIFPSNDDGDYTGYFYTAGNEAMNHIVLLFNGFHRTGMCQFILTLLRMGGWGVQKGVPC